MSFSDKKQGQFEARFPVKTVLGVSIHDATEEDFFIALTHAIQQRIRVRVVTPNPEILVYASRNDQYTALLNNADIALPDGSALQLLTRIRHRTTGADISARLLEYANTHNLTVGCVVRKDGRTSVEEAESALRAKYPNIRLTVFGCLKSEKLEQLPHTFLEAHIILVGLGFPEQEECVLQNETILQSSAVSVGVGGTLDFISGTAQRAPKSFRALRVEWLWRLVREPRRIKRILRATVVFPFLLLTKKGSR